MRLKILSFAAIAMLFAACSSDEPNPPPEAENIPQVANPYRVSLDDALDNAETLLSQISEAETRSGRRVASVKYFTTPSTRSADSDTMLYLVNYENDGGFALLSADSRLRPVYAISDEGSLNMEDTVYNKGLAMFARGVEAEIASVITPPVIDTTFNPERPSLVIKSIHKQVEPLLGISQRRWGQGYPYNVYCPLVDGIQTSAGCAAVAVGQVMSYYQWPQSYGGETFPWGEMNNGTNNERVAKLFYLLGKPENLWINYNASGSIAYITLMASHTFENMGYQNPGQFKNFTKYGVWASMSNNKKPILCRGTRDEDISHVWVIDGCLQYKFTNNLAINPTITLGNYLFHCVWGWGGISNGYFYWNDGFSGEPVENAVGDGDSTGISLPGTGYSVDMMYLDNFIPNK